MASNIGITHLQNICLHMTSETDTSKTLVFVRNEHTNSVLTNFSNYSSGLWNIDSPPFAVSVLESKKNVF